MLSPVEITSKQSAVSGFVIERTAKRMKQACQQYLTQAGIDLTVDQWVLLQELHKLDGQGQNDLARKTFKDAPTVTRIIDLLCKKGLTERQVAPEDRRKFNITLTKAGKSLVREALPVIQEFRLQAYQNLSDTEIDILTGILDRIFENLQ
ncbi:MAG: MarR family transcriptional regulator [Lewinellaceae bacterium]|nr:MarR family transcriptional regulator [Lewinellaceae bacterium]